MKLLARLPIYRRLFLFFFLATLIPDLIIGGMGLTMIQVLSAHGIGTGQTGPLVVGTISALLCSTALVMALGYVMNLTITQPLVHLVEVTRRITNGETGVRARITGRDEIALVAGLINQMLDHIVQLAQDARQQHAALQAQVERLMGEVSGVGEGDLRLQAEVTYGTLGVLADAFNYMVEALSQLIVRVKLVAHEVQRDTTLTSQHLSLLVQQATRQIQQIEEAVSEVVGMARTCREMAALAQGLDEAALHTRQSASRGRLLVEEMSAKMEHLQTHVEETARQVQLLDERSHEITSVVEVIAEMAHRTNRLALDASIQAAMAGENGKGFAAVADDIRRLAERTKEQSSQISHTVKRVQAHVDQVAVSMRASEQETASSTQVLQQSAITFAEIFQVVDEQAEEIKRMHRATQQQFASSQVVEAKMQIVRGNTQEQHGTMQTVARNMDRLAGVLEHLLHSVEAFKVKEETLPLTGLPPMQAVPTQRRH